MRNLMYPLMLAATAVVAAPFLLTEPKVVGTGVSDNFTPIKVIPYNPSWKCEDCTAEEQYVLAQIQEHTKITDRNALATIMGNIKQESNFTANVCEGGARVSYSCLLYTSPSPRD